MTVWLVEGVIPAGAIATIADLDDPPPEELLANGIDVVLLLHDRADRAFDARQPIRFSVHWRDGLVPGREPPPPFWVRFDLAQGGFVRVDGTEAA